MEKCASCGTSIIEAGVELTGGSCGHIKCNLCEKSPASVVNIGNFDYNPHHRYSDFEPMTPDDHLNSTCRSEEQVVVFQDVFNSDSERRTEEKSDIVVPKIVEGNDEDNHENTKIAGKEKSEKCDTPHSESYGETYNDEQNENCDIPICSIAESRIIFEDFSSSPRFSSNLSITSISMTDDDEVQSKSFVKQTNKLSPIRSIEYNSPLRRLSDYRFFKKSSTTSTYNQLMKSPIYSVDHKNSIRSPGYETPTYRLSDFVVIKKRGEVVGYMSPIRSIGNSSPAKAYTSPRSISCSSSPPTHSYKYPDLRLNDYLWTNRKIVYHPIIYDQTFVESTPKKHPSIVAEVELLSNDSVKIVIHSDVLGPNRSEEIENGQLCIENIDEQGTNKNLDSPDEFGVQSRNLSRDSQTLRVNVENREKDASRQLDVAVSKSRQIENVPDQNKENIDERDNDPTTRATKRKYKDVLSEVDAGKTDPKLAKKRRNHDWSHIEMISKNSFRCTGCEKTFKNLQCKWYHSVCRSKESLLKCGICDRIFNKRSHFEYHERVHKGEKPFVCQVCHKGFATNSKLNRHLVIHEKRIGLECAECGKKFTSKDYLKIHVMTHLKISHECKICQKIFPTELQRKRHERSHSSSRPFKCDVCPKDFKDNFALIKHKRSHGTKRPYRCKKCRQAFLTKSELSRHMSIHSDAKPFVCKLCDKSFRRKDNMLRHARHHHLEKDTPSAEQAVIIAAKKFEDENKKNKRESNAKTKKKTSGTRGSAQVVQRNGLIRESVIKGPVRLKSFVDDSQKLTDPIPHATAVEINRRIEEKIRNQGQSFLPGLHRSIIFNSRTGNGFD